MEPIKSKTLSSVIFIPLLTFIFIRAFFSGLAYPIIETYYEISLISLAIISLFINKKTPFKNSYNIPLLLLLLAYLISTATSINIQNSLNETIKFISYISVFSLVLQINTEQKRILIKTIVVAASIISLYSIYQYFWGYQHTLDYLKEIKSDLLPLSTYPTDILIAKRAIGTFPSPNILGGYLIMIFFLVLNLVKNLKFHPRWFFSSLLIILALVLTKSIGVWLSFTTVLFILFVFSYKSLRNSRLIIIICCIFITFILTFIISNRWERLINLGDPRSSIIQRLNYWRIAIAVIRDYPILGVGPGNSQEVFLNYNIDINTGTRYAHNMFLQQWGEIGPLGFIGMILLIITFITKFTLKSKYLFLAGLAFIFHNLIDITYFIPQTSLFWWVILGLM